MTKEKLYTQKPKAEPHRKRCLACRCWASQKGIVKDFWCKHRKFNLNNYR